MISRIPDGAQTGIVLLHGRGGSASDILSLVEFSGLEQIAAVAPEAPGQSWWPMSFLAPSASLESHVSRGISAVELAIGVLEETGIPLSSIWLAGFSQGGCLALEAFARAGEGLAGVIAFSGGLVGTSDCGVPSPELYGYANKNFDYATKRPGKAWISVHATDPHIPIRRARDSAQTLSRLGTDVALRIHPGRGHSVLPDDIDAMKRLLGK